MIALHNIGQRSRFVARCYPETFDDMYPDSETITSQKLSTSLGKTPMLAGAPDMAFTSIGPPERPIGCPHPLEVALIGAEWDGLRDLPAYGGGVQWVERATPATAFVLQVNAGGYAGEGVSIIVNAGQDTQTEVDPIDAAWQWPGSMRTALDAFAAAVLIPCSFPGLISLDYQDFRVGLQRRAACITVMRKTGGNLESVLSQFDREVTGPLAATTRDDFTSVHVSVPVDLASMSTVDWVASKIEPSAHIGELIFSLTAHRGDEIEVTIFTVRPPPSVLGCQ
ncbi:hypothetical protein [Novilysobacter avium]|uniref:Uncharacterized protein n=1 Tax=Novilysobacter avium TaxID=2781023 RepID=A0A7S6ZUL2_9GAMM|nr:hypothetical protein [Lysobacter avium]QOW21784.1 hypothetical protein INQ42_11215 [Lysobacter avium]